MRWLTCPNDRPGHVGPGERPGGGDRGDCRLMPRGDGPQSLGEGEIAVQRLAGKFLVARPPVVRRKRPGAGRRESASKQARLQRTIGDDAAAMRTHPGQVVLGERAFDRGKRWLHHVDGSDRCSALQQFPVVVRKPDGPDLALFLEVGKGCPIVFYRCAVIGRPMHLVKVDDLDAEPLQRSLHLAAQRFGIADAGRKGVAIVRIPDQPGLGEDQRALGFRDCRERFTNDLLGMTETVDRCRVDPVDAALHRMTDSCNRLAVVLASPAPSPIGAADRPGAKADGGDVEAGAAELALRQGFFAHDLSPC
ncbi:hypothetical protein D9M72_484570 [compost metagenome]